MAYRRKRNTRYSKRSTTRRRTGVTHRAKRRGRRSNRSYTYSKRYR